MMRSITFFNICWFEKYLLRPMKVNRKQKFRKVLLHLSLVLLSYHVCDGRLRGQSDDIEFIGYPHGNFKPLKCNSRLDEDPCISPWSKIFGNRFDFDEMVEIPCGKCIVMYPSKNPYTFSGGLKVLGKLVIHANDIFTTSILVHGELSIESTKPIDGNPDISITWLPSNKTHSFQLPGNEEGSNAICGGERAACGMGGGKPFVVAGGKLDIRGLPSPTMPTWVPIYDVDTSKSGDSFPVISIPPDLQGMYVYQPPNEGCPEDDILLHYGEMTSSISGVFRGSYGSVYEFTANGGLKVTNRTHAQHCPIVDLKHVRHCLQPDKTYLLTAKILLTQHGTVDQTECARGDDTKCMSIFQLRMSGRGIGTSYYARIPWIL